MLSLESIPAVGHAPAFFADKLGFLARSARRADVFEVRLGRGRTFLLNHPDDIRHVLVTDHHRFTKHARLVRPDDATLFGEALVGTPKAEHAPRRRALQPVYQQQHLAVFADVVERCVDELGDRWANRSEIDLVAETVALAHRIRIRVLLGEDAPEAAAALPAALAARQRYIARTFLSPVPWAARLPGAAKRDYRRAAPSVERLVGSEIRRRRDAPRDDLLSRLLETTSGDGRVFDEARTFLASYEVSSRALAWSLHLVAEHPDVQDRLAREALDTPDLVGYPQMVLSEALRLYPPSWLFVRMALDRVELPSGPVLPPGSRVFVSPYATHRDARRFPEPERFDPERFRPGPELRARPRYAYFPFGGGPHVCIGEGFVRMEAALVVTRLAQRFDLRLVPGTDATPSPRVTLELAGAPRLCVGRRATLY
jgi:cytochrome P450